MLMGLYNKLLPKVCKGSKCSKSLKESCYSVAMGMIQLILDELRTIRMHAASDHLFSGPGIMRLFLRVVLEELWVLEELKEALLENHSLIWSNMVSHLFNTYVPKFELDQMTASSNSTQIKCSKLERTINAQRKMIWLERNRVQGKGRE